MAKVKFDNIREYLICAGYDLLESDSYTATYFKLVDYTCSVQVFIDFSTKFIEWKVAVDYIYNKEMLYSVLKAYDIMLTDKKGLKEYLKHE